MIFNSSYTQTYIVQLATNYLSDKFEINSKIKKIQLSVFNKLEINDIIIYDHHQDTLFYSKKIYLDLTDVVSTTLFDNKQNVFKIDKIKLEKPVCKIITYQHEDENNLTILLNKISTPTDDTSSTDFQIINQSLVIEDGKFVFINYNDSLLLQNRFIPSNFQVSKINLQIDDTEFSNISQKTEIQHLTAWLDNQIFVQNISGIFHISPQQLEVTDFELQTPDDELYIETVFRFDKWDDWSNFVEKVYLSHHIDGIVSPKTVTYFIPDTFALDFLQPVKLQLYGKGLINNWEIEQMKLSIPELINLSTKGNIKDITTLEKSKFAFNPFNLHIELEETGKLLQNAFHLPMGNYQSLFHTMEFLNIQGNISGTYKDIYAFTNIQSNAGKLSTNARLMQTTLANSETKYQLDGNIKTDIYKLDKILQNKKIKSLSGSFSLNGFFAKNHFDFKVKSSIDNLHFNNYNYSGVYINGQITDAYFNGLLNVYDDNIQLDFSGLYNFQNSLIIAQLDLSKLNLKALNFTDKNLTLSSCIYADAQGSTLDNITGNIELDNIILTQNTNSSFEIDKIQVNIQKQAEEKNIKLLSDLASLQLKGEISFEGLQGVINNLLSNSLPVYFQTSSNNKSKENFVLNAEIYPKPVTEFLSFFNAPYSIDSVLYIDGIINSYDSLIQVSIQPFDFRINNMLFKNTSLSVVEKNNVLTNNLYIQNLFYNDTLSTDNIALLTKIFDNNVFFDLSWKNNSQKQYVGNFSGNINIIDKQKCQINTINSELIVNDSIWNVNFAEGIIIDSNYIFIDGITFNTSHQSLLIQGMLSAQAKDKLNINFENFLIENFNFLFPSDIQLYGKLNGKIVLSNLFSDFYVESGLNIDNLRFNDNSIGSGNISTTYQNSEKQLLLTGFLSDNKNKEFKLYGKYYTTSGKLELYADVTKLDLQIIEPFTTGIISDISGFADGKINITGTLPQVDIKGQLNLHDARLTVDYLKTQYTIPLAQIIVDKDWIGVDLIKVFDSENNVAELTGTVIHENFSNLNYDFTINTNNFMALNTKEEDNNLFYGTVFIEGMANISGYEEIMEINADVTTKKNTRFYIPLSNPEEVEELDFVQFISSNKEIQKSFEEKTDLSGLMMHLNIAATNDAEVQIIFDEKVGDIIKARGQGDINIEISPDGQFNIFGEYTLSGGDYLFTLQNVVNKKFNILPNSNISWTGDAYNANLDIWASYRTRAALKNLGLPIDTSGKRITVDVLLNMSGPLSNPLISFDINLPNSPSQINEEVKTALKNSDYTTKEALALLVTSSFIPLPEAQGVASGGGNIGGSNSAELLSNQLSNWLSQISNDFDLGFNYRPADQQSGSEVELGFSTQLFNDRLNLQSSLGVKNDISQSQSSNLVGDFIIEYKISKDGKLKAKAFNQSNEYNAIYSQNAKYTQGVGLSYTESFSSWKEFFRKIFGKNSAK